MIRLFAVLALTLIVTACSSFEEGSVQEVTLTTPGATDTRCFVRNSRFLYVINPPRRFEIEKSDLPYTVTCLAPGNRRKTVTLPSFYNTKSNQNIYNGFVPGAAVDLASGAIFRYPDQVIVDFTGMRPEPMPLPDYQTMLNENPLIRGMEEFRPGDAALQSDEGQVVEPMRKRPPGDFDDTFGTVLSPGEGNGGDSAGASPAAASGQASQPPRGGGESSRPSIFSGPPSAPPPQNATGNATNGAAGAAPSTSTGTAGKTGGMHGLPSWDSLNSGSGSGGFAGGTSGPPATGSPTSLSR